MTSLKVWAKGSSLRLASDMAYKENFILTSLGTVLQTLIGPIVMVMIYSSSSGIPGWSFEEFLLFQGTLTILFGCGHVFFTGIPLEVIKSLEKGHFDKYLTKPLNTLGYLTAISMDWDGWGEILAGIVITAIAFVKLKLPVISLHFVVYLALLIFGCIFQYAVMIAISATSFLVVRSWALFDLWFKASDFARYPLSIYSPSLVFIFTFLFPVAISAFYPAEVLLRGFNILMLVKIILPVIVFYGLSLLYWNAAMKKYSSAGG